MADQQNAAKDDISEDELDQIIQDMSKDDVEPEKPVLEVVQSRKQAVASPVNTASSTSDQALTLEMNGVINLKLRFQNGDRHIEVFCTNEFLTCTMADGTEFKIPTGATSKVRNVA
jgi:hypothetical protein